MLGTRLFNKEHIFEAETYVNKVRIQPAPERKQPVSIAKISWLALFK